MKRRAPRAGLSDEERALWRRVAATARPLRPAAEEPATVAPPASAPAAEPVPRPVLPEASPPVWRRPTGRAEPTARWAPPSAERPGPIAPNTPGLDRGTARRLGRGRIAPQARLDMHGMTVDRAHAALGRFLAEAAAGGLRCVLVVTGKGGDGRGGEGVLRRETPRWLTAPPFAAMVVGVFEAHSRHGGGGALYVYLKRRR
jgi:DNA-nicking Smr family endonuclease